MPPGEGDVTLGRVALDSPFGQLLSRAELGSSFAVKIPNGARRVTVVDISYPRGNIVARPAEHEATGTMR